MTWQLHGDPMMWVAGIRALYLQALHSRAVRGVMQNSDFRRDAWGRLMRTADFVGTTTYGTTEAAEKAGARVRKIHRMLGATDPDTGERHGVDEPELLLWVHCTEIDSYLQVARRSGFRLTDEQADQYIPNTGSAPAWWASTRRPYRRARRRWWPSSRRCAPNSPLRPRPARWTTSCSARRHTPSRPGA